MKISNLALLFPISNWAIRRAFKRYVTIPSLWNRIWIRQLKVINLLCNFWFVRTLKYPHMKLSTSLSLPKAKSSDNRSPNGKSFIIFNPFSELVYSLVFVKIFLRTAAVAASSIRITTLKTDGAQALAFLLVTLLLTYLFDSNYMASGSFVCLNEGPFWPTPLS